MVITRGISVGCDPKYNMYVGPEKMAISKPHKSEERS